MDAVLKELQWKKKRLGIISASELSDILSASGKVIDGNIAYVRKKRFERVHGYALPVSARTMDIGKEQEPYAVQWFRANVTDMELVYSQELPEIPFWKADWGRFGASPDAFTPDEKIVVEVKTVVGNEQTEFFADNRTSYDEKREAVAKTHGPQLAGQFLANPKVEEIWVLKYLYQHDDIDDDTDSPLEPWRGLIFKFKREEFALEDIKHRIILFDKFIDSDYDAKSLKGGFTLGEEDGEYTLIPPQK